MHSGAKEKAFETENLKCAILTADCSEFIEISYSGFFSPKLKFVQIDTLPWGWLNCSRAAFSDSRH